MSVSCPKAALMAPKRHFRVAQNNRHRQTGTVDPVRANFCLKQARQNMPAHAPAMLLVHAWAGLTLRRRARKSLTQQNTMDLDRSEDLD